MQKSGLKNGLSSAEVKERTKKGLVNKTEKTIVKSNWEILAGNLFTLFNLFNFIIGLALFFVKAYSNMLFLNIIVINVSMGTIQEIKAKKLLEKLAILSEAKVTVVRDTQTQKISTEDVVIDELIMLTSGNQLCADAEVLEGEVEVNESLLTGESDNILKKCNELLLSGSYVVSGQCYAKVKKVGASSYAAQITAKVQKQKKVHSELLDSMRKATKFTGFFVVPIGLMLFIQSYFLRDELIKDSVTSTAAGLLGMFPKGLVLLISIALVTGVVKLAKKKVLVQEMHSIETLARVDVLCLDKTGTITEGKMKVTNLYKFNERLMPVPLEDVITAFVQNMSENNATFLAIKEAYLGKSALKMTASTPFTSERKWSSATFEKIGTIVMGAPEILVQKSDFKLPGALTRAQKAGKRILLCGFASESITNNQLGTLQIVAAIELDDPLKKNAREMFGYFKDEGVIIKVISGDSPLTVASVAEQAGIEGASKYIDMTGIKDEEIKVLVNEYNVFARVSPEQKSLVIRALKEAGHTVAMTGDGVNDVIALREANIGITLPNGSEVTKQVCQLVMLDDDFRVLKDVLMEGRRVVNNLTGVAKIFFVKTIYSLLLCILNIILNIPFPFIPIQVTLVNATIEAYSSFFMTFEPNQKKVTSPFLSTVVRSALPYGVTIILSFIATMLLTPLFDLQSQAETIMYYLLGFVSILAVVKVCQPLNKLRLFLCITTALSFYAATYLFRNILNLQMLNKDGLILYLALALMAYPLKVLIAKITNADKYETI